MQFHARDGGLAPKSRRVSIRSSRRVRTGRILQIRHLALSFALQTDTRCPECGRSGVLRPDVVWFGETPYHLDVISEALHEADLFVCIGTSGVVYPAAGFVRMAAEAGCRRLIEINLDSTGNRGEFTECRLGPATIEVVRLVDELLSPTTGVSRR